MAKDSETVLEGFQEGPLKFPPTYKFDVGTDTYDTRLVKFWPSGNWCATETSCRNSAPFLWRFLPAGWKARKRLFVHSLFSRLCFSVLRAAGKSVNRLGPTGSCGAWGPPRLPTLPWTQGSAAPLQGWPAGPKWHNTATGVTWSTQPVTTNLCPPSSPCRWDTSQVFLRYYFVNGVKIVNWLNKWFKQSSQSDSFSYFFMLSFRLNAVFI